LYPHGISLRKNPNGFDRLFVVHHPPAPPGSEQRSDSQVVIFDIVDDGLKFVRRVTTDLPYSLNDVVAASYEHFYATIDEGSITKVGRLFESYGRLARGGIAYGSTGQMTKVMGNLIYPNGIQINHDGTKVYVSESSGSRLLTYDRDINSGVVSFDNDIDLGSGLDNLEWDMNGNLWIGAHPKMLDYVQHSANHENRSASQVLRVNLNEQISVDEIYLSNGNPLSGSSVAAPYDGHLLIGSVYEPFILDCVLTTESENAN
jgi:arylesterase/paraoxonase